ncbi:4350_t:CDS:2 [Entrophospora sp. SA101]|nr:4350_t:CDS:2 [Entrophospora sp. SA101]CAJ0823695.1 19470_t:CDS:2 [Entrophospora sp. SA101]
MEVATTICFTFLGEIITVSNSSSSSDSSVFSIYEITALVLEEINF